jgi:sulfur-carrier protein
VRVRVLYFAAVRELVGRSEDVLDLPLTVRSIGALSAHLGQREPALASALRMVRFARNEVFADEAEPLADGDVVAIIPPVAGG